MVRSESFYMSNVTHYLLSQPNQPPKDVRRMMMMTMIGETLLRPNPPTVQIQIPPWDPLDDNNGPPSPPVVHSPYSNNASGSILDSLTALHRYLPSNDPTAEEELVLDAFSCDHFRMYEFKVRRCARGRSHDWTECPYAHPGEKARRRDPRRYHYSGTACPDFRKGAGCKKGDSCEFAHGVFECWLHPARYRTQPCKDGSNCRRRVCFFAHTPGQLRVLPHGGIGSGSGPGEIEFGSPRMRHLDAYMTMPGAGVGSGSFLSSPTSILASPPVSPPSDSPPMSPSSPQVASELVASMRGLQLGKMRMGPGAWGMQAGTKLGSPLGGSSLRPGPNSLPSTPTRARGTLSGLGLSDIWDLATCEEEPAMERVESGRDIRAKMYAKLSKENSLERGAVEGGVAAPDVGWISELVK